MMYSRGHGCGSGYVWGDGYGDGWAYQDKGDGYKKRGIGDGYGIGIDGYDDGDGNGDGYEYGIGIGGDGRVNDREYGEEEQLSAIRLLSDATQDINFYIAQLHLMVQRTTTLKEETK